MKSVSLYYSYYIVQSDIQEANLSKINGILNSAILTGLGNIFCCTITRGLLLVQYIGQLHLNKAECCSLYVHAELEHRVVHVKETSFISDAPGPIRKHEVLWKMQEKYI